MQTASEPLSFACPLTPARRKGRQRMGTGRALRGRKLVERAIARQFPDSVLGRDEAERRTLRRTGSLRSMPLRPTWLASPAAGLHRLSRAPLEASIALWLDGGRAVTMHRRENRLPQFPIPVESRKNSPLD